MSEDCHDCCGDDGGVVRWEGEPVALRNPDGTLLGYPVVEDESTPRQVGDVFVSSAMKKRRVISDVRDIVDEYLIVNGYDGLWNEDAECACEVGNVAPCDGDIARCMPGYRDACDCGDHDWHIVSERKT